MAVLAALPRTVLKKIQGEPPKGKASHYGDMKSKKRYWFPYNEWPFHDESQFVELRPLD